MSVFYCCSYVRFIGAATLAAMSHAGRRMSRARRRGLVRLVGAAGLDRGAAGLVLRDARRGDGGRSARHFRRGAVQPAAGHLTRAAADRPTRRLRRRSPRVALAGRPRLPVTRLRAEQREQHRQRDRPAHLQGRAAVRGRAHFPSTSSLLRPEDALGEQRRGQQPDADRSRAPARPGRPVPSTDPYNLYFTPDGRYAIVVDERMQTLDFRDPHTMQLHHTLPVPCHGVNHMDFTADGRYLLASCEFGGSVIEVDLARQRVVGRPGPEALGRCHRTSSSRRMAASSTSPTWPLAASG